MKRGHLEQLKVRRELWIRCLSGDDRNSVMRQITRMVWNTAAFRVVNEARRIAPPAKEGGVRLNGLMHSLFDHGFFEGQMLAIRRLTDVYPIADDRRKRDVYSLTSLLEDMRKHAHLMTRESIFAAEGLEYDVDSVRRRYEESAWEQRRKGQRTCFVPGNLDWFRLEERHKQVDVFAGASRENRSPDDAVRPVVMEHLKNKVLASCKDLHVYVDKFIAHAASPASRQAVDADSATITLNHLYVAHEAICEVANFVNVHLLTGMGYGMLPIPQYDHLAYIDRPLVSGKGINILRQTWDAYDKETHGWTLWGMEEFRDECRVP